MDTMEHLVLVEGAHELKFEHVRFEMPSRYLGTDGNQADVGTVYIGLFINGLHISESSIIYLGNLLV